MRQHLKGLTKGNEQQRKHQESQQSEKTERNPKKSVNTHTHTHLYKRNSAWHAIDLNSKESQINKRAIDFKAMKKKKKFYKNGTTHQLPKKKKKEFIQNFVSFKN